MNIPRFLQLYKEGKLEDAFISVILDNPLPASTGRVCQHPCEDRCRRSAVDEPVNMRDVHRIIADSVLLTDKFEPMVERLIALKKEPTGREVAVVGAGPAGLTCAYYLALLGHAVTVYDARPEAGGMLRYALPEYRLPKAVLKKELELIERVGVRFQLGTPVGDGFGLNDLAHQYDAVFLAIGTWKEAHVQLPGTELGGVLHALPFLEAVARDGKAPLGRRVAVIGGGNAAIDSARSARRLGSEVTVVYRRERKDMPAIPDEVEAAEHEGVQFVFLASPHRVVGDKQGLVRAIEVVKTKLGEFDTSGRRRPVPTDEVVRVDCDTVILAVGEKVDPEFTRTSGLRIKDAGTVEVDRYSMETSRERFYAGGDLVTGASNVSRAMRYGRQAARKIDKKLMGVKRVDSLWPAFDYAMEPPEKPSESPRQVPAEVAPGERVKSSVEVSLGLVPAAALEEAARCLRCDVRGEES
jgi:NADH-quinone oxidoreductase subunit F